MTNLNQQTTIGVPDDMAREMAVANLSAAQNRAKSALDELQSLIKYYESVADAYSPSLRPEVEAAKLMMR